MTLRLIVVALAALEIIPTTALTTTSCKCVGFLPESSYHCAQDSNVPRHLAILVGHRLPSGARSTRLYLGN